MKRNNLKILIIAPACANNQSGFALRVFQWIQMIKDHAQVTYLCTYQEENPNIAHQFYYQMFPDNWKSKIKKLWTYYKTDFSGLRLNEKPDIVQIHTPYFFGLKKFFPNTPVVLVEHDVNWNLLKYDMSAGPGLGKLPFQFPLVPWMQWRAKKYEKDILNEAKHTFVCSSVDRNEIIKELPHLKQKISVVPNCLDVTNYTPSEKKGDYVLFMGSLTYSANRDAAKIICEELAPRLPEIPFRILGSGTYAKEHPKNVQFLGHVKEIKSYLEYCRLFIVPLRFGSGTRWKILEALAVQRPVLSTPKGAEGLEVTHGENIWLEENWDSFVSAIKEFWGNSEKAKGIAQNGRKLVERKYDYKIYTPEVMNIYQSLLAS